jgi:hypothetical protein
MPALRPALWRGAKFRAVITLERSVKRYRKDALIQVTASILGASVVAILDVCVGARYCAKLIRKQACPRIATWLIFEIGVVMSLAAYFASQDHSIVKAALNVTDGIVVTVILGSLVVERRGRKIHFTRNEQLCLVISCITMAAWTISRTAWVGFLGFQVVMSVAYFPTIESVWHWKPGRSPEPLETWSVNAIAALIGVVVDITGSHDYVAMLYPLRAFILCMIIVALVGRWEQKTQTNRILIL